jgi:hypothetical protein
MDEAIPRAATTGRFCRDLSTGDSQPVIRNSFETQVQKFEEKPTL